MVEFEFQPWKKIIVHEVIKYPLEHFLRNSSLGIAAGQIGRPLTWADGIIFQIGRFRDTDDIIKEKHKGRLHYSGISYTILDNHQPEFKVEGNIRIPVIDVSDNTVFKEMIAWIKQEFETEK